MITFRSFDELVEGDVYYADFDEKLQLQVIRIDDVPMWISPKDKNLLGEIVLNCLYSLTFLRHKNKEDSKWIDPRILKARKEWGMEAVAIFL